MKDYEIIVVGGGHAGVEACAACAHMGLKTLLITLNKKMISNMPCNPSIGGSAKGIVVREVDALGGMMGIAADHEYLQMKMLNTGKGPGVQCLRAQEDKHAYPAYMQHLLDEIDNLDILEKEVVALSYHDDVVDGVILKDGEVIKAKAVVISTGTYMDGAILRGHKSVSGGPDGENPSIGLSDSLRKMGLEIIRLKTGTPPRIKKSSIDLSKATIQPGMAGDFAFSYTTKTFVPVEEQLPCYLIYTNGKTHKLITDNLDRTATFNGLQTGVGPRYCPSIESKVMTFKDKERHQLFLEPEFRNGESIYLQGFSTAMDEEMQVEMVHSIVGLEHAEFLKYAYAIEYDALVPTQFDLTLRVKKYKGLYGAGQICGTSGYEEAAGLGLVAGINAANYVLDREPFILKRNESYIGVMIDDIVTKGTNEPYRLLSSRAEYRLLLRHDNADLRLTPYGFKLGLISNERYQEFLKKNENIEKARQILDKTHLGSGKATTEYLKSQGIEPLTSGVSASEFLKRPGVKYKHVYDLIPELQEIPLDFIGISQLEIMVKYEGYIKREEKEALSFSKYEEYKLPDDIDYLNMHGLALEARQKLDKIRPINIGQAGRISGVNPSDISILILNLKKKER
ncbi:MAG: tRNA uridine-5-carboxymethylaminomethyl(34) synthesis enzyme MnmG [Bacilli bacterium]|nr:tRNA uridine-5-carboxymethylaminomethyl(34) synthesis enzyme MnmG [Bacilli bacterium]